MRVVLQRVNRAHVDVDGVTVGKVGKGLVAFLGVAPSDDNALCDKMVDKISRLRIFADQNGKTNLYPSDVSAGILVVSQFTLLADLSSNRPSFSRNAPRETAEAIFNHFILRCKEKFATAESGRFATHMHVHSENDGPFTLILDMQKEQENEV